jgi:hypothetical protein
MATVDGNNLYSCHNVLHCWCIKTTVGSDWTLHWLEEDRFPTTRTVVDADLLL